MIVKIRNLISFVCQLLILVRQYDCLYEDQAGLFDWRLSNVGKAVLVEYMQATSRIIVGTQENTIAAINAKDGKIGWRHIFEKGSNGVVDDMKTHENYLVTSLSGGGYVRCFNAVSGSLHWENSVTMAQPDTQSAVAIMDAFHVSVLTHDRLSAYYLDNGGDAWNLSLPDSSTVKYASLIKGGELLYVIGVVSESHVTLSTVTFDGTLKSTRLVPAPWITHQSRCKSVNGAFFVCADTKQPVLWVLPLADNAGSFQTVSLPDGVHFDHDELMFYAIQSPESSTNLNAVALRVNRQSSVLLVLDSVGNVKMSQLLSGVSAVQVVTIGDRQMAVSIARVPDTSVVEIKGYDLSNNDMRNEFSHIVTFPSHHGHPLQVFGMLTRNRDASFGFTLLLVSEDHSLTLVEQINLTLPGKVLWTREEALASILSVEMVDLPVSQIMAKMEDEFGTHGESVVGLFANRFSSQLSQLRTFIEQLRNKFWNPRHGFVDQHESYNDDDEFEQVSDNFDEDYLTRDDFNLHKMIVAVTLPGKIYGIDSRRGRIVWRSWLPNVEPFHRADQQTDSPLVNMYSTLSMPLFVQRTTAHFPHQPLCTVLCRHRLTKQPLLYSFHPITGSVIDGLSPTGKSLDYNIISAVALAQMDSQFLRPLLLLDTQKQYHVYPSNDVELVREVSPSLFTFVTDVKTGIITGYSLTSSPTSQLVAKPMWTVDTNVQAQTITNIVAKRAIEHVHSQGIVLEDRSVLYKYLNPNLIAVVAEGKDSQHKSFVTIYLVDAVSGNLIFHCVHKKAKGPIQLVHADNWVIYTYWNQKLRRIELAVLEMYEGNRQSNSTAFSSFHPPPPPIVMRQAYIFPGHLSAIAATVTEKGIASKELLFALENGGILGLPKQLIDPRRPEVMSHEAREEGLIPYIPELPRPFDRIINYNQSVFNIRGIHTAPAGLESTSLVLCYGLDLFYTRVMPSKMFDVLKEDFDYVFISSVLIGMIAVSIISQKLAARKALNRMWK